MVTLVYFWFTLSQLFVRGGSAAADISTRNLANRACGTGIRDKLRTKITGLEIGRQGCRGFFQSSDIHSR